MHEPKLKRSLSLPLITFYGLGTILGAGIYVLVGEVAGRAGLFAPVAFIVAALIASFTALSYAELSARFPKSAGEAVYVQAAFSKKHFSTVVGLLVVLTGLVSSATLINGFKGYFQIFFPIPSWIVITLLVALLLLVSFWGILESVAAATLITLVEIGGLLLILWVTRGHFAELPSRIAEFIPSFSGVAWAGIMSGAFLAFYAFIGFEDMVNVAEEVKNPKRNLPIAIIIALIASTLLYMLVALAAVLALPVSELVGNGTPLAVVYQSVTGNAPTVISIISMFAIINGALIQIIMSSRILYGLSSAGHIHAKIGKVHAKTRTPHVATFIVAALVLVLALWLPLVTLAEITSFVILLVFAAVNLSLAYIKNRDGRNRSGPNYHIAIPVIGMLASLSLVLLQAFAYLS